MKKRNPAQFVAYLNSRAQRYRFYKSNHAAVVAVAGENEQTALALAANGALKVFAKVGPNGAETRIVLGRNV